MNRSQRRANSRHHQKNNSPPIPKLRTGNVQPSVGELFQIGLKNQQAGRLTEAEFYYRAVLAAQPDHAVAYCHLGMVHFDRGKLDEAVAAYRNATRNKRDYAEAHSNLGNALRRQAKLEEAVTAHRKAIRIKPDFAVAHCNLGNALQSQGKLDEAVAAYRDAIRIKPDWAVAFSNLGVALFGQGKLDEGVAAFRQAIALQPNFADAHNNLGFGLVQLGRLAEARVAFEQAIRLAPRNVTYRRNLGDIIPFVAGDNNLVALEQLAGEHAVLSVGDQIELHFALGKAYDDVGRHADAFRQWLDGNALKRSQIAYNEAGSLRELDRSRTIFTSEFIRTWQNVGNQSSIPIFILGMPRSGTTLVEQILASHPQVFGGGELEYLRKAVEGIRTPPGDSAAFPELKLGMASENFRDVASRYLAEIERLAPGASHVTDKMPSNFVFAGLIHLALPNATIIHTIRDPIDTCLSCFSKLFSGDQNYAYDLAELGRYYRHYQSLMEYWHRVLPPDRILDVRYEDVVDDLEGQARRIIAHCGLDWDPRCLAFYQTDRPVRTASATQVRQPIYHSAIGRWRAYVDWLGPLLAELDLAGLCTGRALKSEPDHLR